LFLIFIISMSSLTANFVHIIDSAGQEGYQIFILSTITLIPFHIFYYKIYLFLINAKSLVTSGLLYSSLAGFLLVTTLSIFNFYSDYNIESSNKRITLTFFFLIVIYIISGVVLSFIDGYKNTKSKSKIKIALLALAFYILNLTFCMILFLFYLIAIGGFG